MMFYNNIIYLFTEIGLLPGGSGYFTCIQNKKLVTSKFKSGAQHILQRSKRNSVFVYRLCLCID